MASLKHQGYINHVGLVLDASSSMGYISKSTVQVADAQIKYLAERSQDTDQETRATVYQFADRVECLFYDKDVLRLPSIKDVYRPDGMTALIDAVLQAISDLRQTATIYGDHAFLLYVLTDGAENASRQRPDTLRKVLGSLPDNWTVAVFVPNQQGVFEAKKLGFAPGNIAIWDTSERGVREVGETIKQVTDAYIHARTTGVRGTSNLFNLTTENLTPNNVHNLLPVPKDAYTLIQNTSGVTTPIRDVVEWSTGEKYRIGSTFYELIKPEVVQAKKQIAVLEGSTGKVWSGSGARHLLGLPDEVVKVSPGHAPGYMIFVQSTSVNRNILPEQCLIHFPYPYIVHPR